MDDALKCKPKTNGLTTAFNTDEISAIVLDNGSDIIKAGFAGDDEPKAYFPSIVGHRRPGQRRITDTDDKDAWVGHSAQAKRAILDVESPIQRGVITNWDAMEEIWCHVYDELSVLPNRQPVLMTDSVGNPKWHREKMVQVMIEKFNVPGFQTAMQPVLSVYSSGRGCAVSVEIGDGLAQIIPIFEGYTMPHSIRRIDIAGADITDYLMKLMDTNVPNFHGSADRAIAKDMKEKHCYVASDYYEEKKTAAQNPALRTTYELPDGNKVSLKEERFCAPEVLFQPWLHAYGGEGLHYDIFNCLKDCDIDTRRDLYGNILLTGGCTKLPGFKDRMQREMVALAPTKARVKVLNFHDHWDQQHSVWIGGSILASLSTFQRLWITSEEYSEHGPTIAHKKCTL